MPAKQTSFSVRFVKAGTPTLLARLTSRGALGAFTGKSGEGRWITQADVSAISYRVYDVTDENNPTMILGQTAANKADVILDTPDAGGELWTLDRIGYNFALDLPATAFPQSNRTIRVEVKITLVSGGVAWAKWQGPTDDFLTP